MPEALILTLDAGTTGVKCAAFQKNGVAQFSCVESYPTYYPASGWAQQKPQQQLDAAIRSIQLTLSQVAVADICALVFTGTMNGCIPIDHQGNALYDNIIHSDVRTQPQTEIIERAISLETYYNTTGNRTDVHSGLPKYMWLKEHEPEIYAHTFKFVNIKDYLYGKFTGLPGRTDRSDASLCNCIDIHKGHWAWNILHELEIDHNKMPELRESTDVTGRLSPAFAALTGLPAGLPVAIGAGDGACAAHGARLHTPGAAYMNIGSSAWVSAMSKTPALDSSMRIFNYFDMDSSCYNVCGTVQCGAAACNWAIENLIYPGMQASNCDFDALEKLALSSPPGAEGVFFVPTLMGERTPWWTAKASGALLGFTLYHQPRHIAMAVYEGVMQALNLCAEILGENSLPISALTLIGGGAKSKLWGQMAASMFDANVHVHQTPHEATSLGAAFAAGVGIGMYHDFQEAGKQIRTQHTFVPEKKNTDIYKKHLSIYKTLYPAMKDVYGAIFDYQQTPEA